MQKLQPVLANGIKKYGQILRFIIAGGTGLGVNLVVLYVFTDILGIYYLISTVWAYVISFVVSFLLQKFWTFQDDSRNKLHIQLPFYIGMQSANLGLNTILMYAFVEYLHFWYLFSQVIIAAGIAVSSFYINKTYIFKFSAPGSLPNEDSVR